MGPSPISHISASDHPVESTIFVDARGLAAQKEPGTDAFAVGVAVRAVEAQESPGVVVLVALPAVGLPVGDAA